MKKEFDALQKTLKGGLTTIQIIEIGILLTNVNNLDEMIGDFEC